MLDVLGLISSSTGMDAPYFAQMSDSQKKTDITPIQNSLDRVSTLRGVNFKWKDKKISPSLQMGLIAQETEKVFPELIGTNPEGFKTMNYMGLTGALVEAIKELKVQNEALRQRIEKLEKNK